MIVPKSFVPPSSGGMWYNERAFSIFCDNNLKKPMFRLVFEI